MQMAEEWLRTWICLSFIFAWARASRPRFDVSTDMGMVLVPSNAEINTAIFRLRATDQDADFPLVFEIIATTSPVVRVENLPCTLYNKVCQANVFLTRRLVAGRLHDFVVRVKDSKGDSNSMQATILVTNATTPRDKIFPHLPSLIMVPEDAKPEKELDYLLVNSNPWTGKPVYIELWQPKELFKIRQRQVGTQTKGVITLIGELDFETQSMYTLTMYATDPYTEIGKDTRNIAGAHVVVIVQDVQDVAPVFTLAPPLTKINNTVKPGDVILRVHAEDGDKGVPREVTYGLVSEGNPFTSFFNVSESTGEIVLARPLEELTQITHVGAPIVLKIVAEEIRSSRDEPPAQATVVELGLLLGEPGNSPPYFESDNYVAWINENSEPGTVVMFSEAYSTIIRDEDIGKAGVFALTLENNNGTFEISPAVAEKVVNFIITVRDNAFIDYEKFKSLRFKIRAQEVGPATNLSASASVTIFLRDVNDNPPVFDSSMYEVTLSENPSAGTKVVQVHATDVDSGLFGKLLYTRVIGDGSEAFDLNPDSGLITVTMGSVLDREQTSRLELTIEAKDEDGRGLRGTTTLVVNLLDVNDNSPIFERATYEFLLNSELTNFTMPAFIKAFDADAEPPNNVVRYEIIHGNYDDKFQLDEETGELILHEPIGKRRRTRWSRQANAALRRQFRQANIESLDEPTSTTESSNATSESSFRDFHLISNLTEVDIDSQNQSRRRRAEDTPLFILTARAYDLGVPHLSNTAQIRIMRPMSELARTVTFVMPGENPDPTKTAETLATITGSRVVIQEIKPYVSQVEPGTTADVGKRSVVIARVENGLPGTVVDIDKIREILAANGFGIISGMDNVGSDHVPRPSIDTTPDYGERSSSKNATIVALTNEEVTVYQAENKLLTWLLILLALLLLIALITLIACCICPFCPFYMEPRKRRIHSSETLVMHSGGRPKRHLHRKPIKIIDGHNGERKEAWSAEQGRQHWQFNRRNTMNPGIASLPGDVAPGQSTYTEHERQQQAHPSSLRGFETSGFGDSKPSVQAPGQQQANRGDERIYMEDVEAGHQQNRSYEQAELDSLRRHELERGSDTGPATTRQDRTREQHFYRDGNAEVLRLITRGEIEDHKEFRNRARFIEDQKLRRNQDPRDSYHENYHEVDIDRSLESHRRANEPTEILILPDRLEMQQQPSYGHRQHPEHLRLIAERNYKYPSFKVVDDETDYRVRGAAQRVTLRDATETLAGETSRSGENTSRREPGNPSYGVHDAELLRQNALLTRLLLEKEAQQHLHVPVIDSSSFLETQSLPGHVAIATQTDRTTSTQTEFFAKSRSDNEESEEDPRSRRKARLKGRLETKEDFKKMKTIWVKTPIPEESRAQSGVKKSAPLRTKIEVLESRKICISPERMKDQSNSTKSGESDGNEEDEEETAILRQIGKPDRGLQSHKITSKTVCTTRKKANDDSTTPSPESKDKKILAKVKVRKKPEKAVRGKKPESTDSERNHFMEPSFRVLEREISSIHHKIRQFGDKKLKILKKNSGKREKEEDNDASKKSELPIKRTQRNASSRDSSPKKITVEQKPKPEEAKQTSSSDMEDFTGGREQFEMQTRSRSLLRRQTHLENSDTKSSSDMNGRSKDDSSSPADVNSSPTKKQQKQSENDKLKRAQMEKKSLQSQKIIKRPIKPNGLIEPKKKGMRSKAEAKSTTSVETKSPTMSKESVQLTTASEEGRSPARETLAIDLDKLAEDVRGVVEKEISSLTQAAREALSKSDNDRRDERAAGSPVKMRKSRATEGRGQVEKYRASRSMEIKERKEYGKAQKVKGRSMEAGSPTKQKPDEAISFIVIENNRSALSSADHSKKFENHVKNAIFMEKSTSDGLQDKLIVSRENETTMLIGNAEAVDRELKDADFDDATKTAPEKITETTVIVLSANKEIEKSTFGAAGDFKMITANSDCEFKSVGNGVNGVGNMLTETKEDGKNILMLDKVDETSSALASEIEEMKKLAKDKIDEMNKLLTAEMDEMKKIRNGDAEKAAIEDKGNSPLDDMEKTEKVDDSDMTDEQGASEQRVEASEAETELTVDSAEQENKKDVPETREPDSPASTSLPSATKEDEEKKVDDDKSPSPPGLTETRKEKSKKFSESRKAETSVSIVVTTEENGTTTRTETNKNVSKEGETRLDESVTITNSPPKDAAKQTEQPENKGDDSNKATSSSEQPSQTENHNGENRPVAQQPEAPIFEITNAIGEDAREMSEDESSSASDASNKTALNARHYGSPLPSISSESYATTDTRTRQKWSPSVKVDPPTSPGSSSCPGGMKITTSPSESSIVKLHGEERKSSARQSRETTTRETTEEFTECTEQQRKSRSSGRPVVVAVKRKEQLLTSEQTDRRKSPRRERLEERTRMSSEQRRLEVLVPAPARPKQPSPHKRPKPEEQPGGEESPKTTTTRTIENHPRDPEIANARSRYMAWYQQKRAEMDRKRRERKDEEEQQQQRPRATTKRTLARVRKPKPDEQDARPEDEAKADKETGKSGPKINRLRIRPLVNVESEQLKAIVRQGRRLRKAEGAGKGEDPPVQIFVPDRPAPEPKPAEPPRHHLFQHSEYKYERAVQPVPVPALPFFLHPPPPPPHPSPEHFQDDLSDSCRRLDDDLDSGIAVSLQGGTRLRHQQLLEKKSVFDIAYNEAAPAQLRSDSSTPPS